MRGEKLFFSFSFPPDPLRTYTVQKMITMEKPPADTKTIIEKKHESVFIFHGIVDKKKNEIFFPKQDTKLLTSTMRGFFFFLNDKSFHTQFHSSSSFSPA